MYQVYPGITRVLAILALLALKSSVFALQTQVLARLRLTPGEPGVSLGPTPGHLSVSNPALTPF